MGFQEQAAAKLARKFGTVSAGKHEGCQIALGNDPSKKVEATYSFSQIIFLKDTEEKGRYNLDSDLKGMAITSVDPDGLQVKILFADNEECDFLLETNQKKIKDMNKLVYMLKVWMGQAKTNMTAAEAIKDIKIFMQSTMHLLVESSLKDLEEYYKANDALEDLDRKLLTICRKRYQK